MDDPSKSFQKLEVPGRGIRRHGLSADGHWAYTIQWDDHLLRLWDLTVGEPAASGMLLGKVKAYTNDVRFTADSRWLIACDAKTTARVWDLKSKDIKKSSIQLPDFEYGLYAASFSSDGRWLAATSKDKQTRLWDLTNLNEEAKPFILTGHDGGDYRRVFSPDSHWLVTGGNGYSAPRLWNLRLENPHESPVVLPGNINRVEHFVFSDNGRWLATADRLTAQVWHLRTTNLGEAPLKFNVPREYLRNLRFTPDGLTLICGYHRGTVRFWSLDLRKLIKLAVRQAGRELTEQERAAYKIRREPQPINR